MDKSLAATGTARWRGFVARLLGERVLTHNLIVAGGTVIAGGLGVAFQSLVSHHLNPADYGAVFAVVTLITFIGLPATGFTLLMARQTSRDMAGGDDAASATLLRRGNRAILLAGAALGAGLVVASPGLAVLLNVPTQLLFAAAIGLPFALALPLLLGELQGQQHFLTFSALLISQAGLKLLGALALGFFWGPAGVIAGISLASGASYLAALVVLRHKLGRQPVGDWWRPAMAYLTVVIPSALALAVLLSADVLVVKHFFSTQVAGQYSSVAAIGRAIFWGAAGVATVLFPKVIFRSAQGHGGSHLVGVSLALVAVGGGCGLLLLSAGSRWLLTVFSGSAYAGAAGYLPWYAVGMTLLGAVAVLIAAHQSRGTRGFLAVLLPLTLLEPVAITLVAPGRNVTLLVGVMDACMALILVGLGTLYVIQERAVAVAKLPLPEAPATPVAAQIRVGR
jgi:O-antigen/teichoic acid export membrane protein